MKIELISPITGKISYKYSTLSEKEIVEKVNRAGSTFIEWKNSKHSLRKRMILKVAETLKKNKDKYAKIITSEMGKNIEDSLFEVEKCILVCKYYSDNFEKIVKDEIIKTEAKKSYVTFEPLGVIFGIMPWNFPFWQVFRFAVPSIMAGNTVLLKHASNVPICSLAIENIFKESGYKEGIFQSLLISSSDSEIVIQNENVKAVTLTGSENAGIQVSTLASKYLKKCVLELGGSDPFIVNEDANLDLAVKSAVASRMIVSGQSCIAAKRFIIHAKVVDDFTKKMVEQIKNVNFSPLISQSSINELEHQLEESIKMGAQVLCGGKQENKAGFYYIPTVVTKVTQDMPIWKEETFGPIAPIMTFETDEEAISIANQSKYGLGASVWTNKQSKVEYFIKNLDAGSVFVNSIVKSDPRLPFGGTKLSGYGRELSGYGLKEFVNIKTVWINN